MEDKKQRLLELVGRQPRNQSFSHKKNKKVSSIESQKSLKFTNNITMDRSHINQSMPVSNKYTNAYNPYEKNKQSAFYLIKSNQESFKIQEKLDTNRQIRKNDSSQDGSDVENSDGQNYSEYSDERELRLLREKEEANVKTSQDNQKPTNNYIGQQ
ncbi:UNKNOWN [Stylonychia lemnae]|uniref:Uncharacterized protein n=1 Tax=Stylonychia lemnae TaxID=5949 RepID=A0A078AF87_STYLE|nr:UNKNOWN [Stylonychia lemnae]|eukprot:CDW80506.1 UNKNOWN [Stylonychia lemnae]